jgi:hypothetical protein
LIGFGDNRAVARAILKGFYQDQANRLTIPDRCISPLSPHATGYVHHCIFHFLVSNQDFSEAWTSRRPHCRYLKGDAHRCDMSYEHRHPAEGSRELPIWNCFCNYAPDMAKHSTKSGNREIASTSAEIKRVTEPLAIDF